MFKIRSYVFGFLLLCILFCGGTYYYTKVYAAQAVKLVDFEYERDMADVLSIFDRNWYWLMVYPQEEYDPNYLPHVFKWGAPQADPLKKGMLTIKVLRHEGRVIAFTAYYMKTKISGFLLFVAVDNNFRGKKYGEALVNHALKAMIDRGAKQIQLNTRIDNLPARSLYKKMGFTETVRQGPFVYYTYKI